MGLSLADAQAVAAVRTRRDVVLLDDGRRLADWAVLNADTTALTQEDEHVIGTKSIQFSKSGVVGTVGGVSRDKLDLDASQLGPDAVLELVVDIPDTTLLASVEVRLGTDATNYASFLFADTDFVTGVSWDRVTKELAAQGKALQVGTGLDLSSIQYMEVRVNFDAAANTLADIHVDSVLLRAA